MVLFSKARKVPKSAFFGSHSDPGGEAGNPASLSRSFPADCLSVPACTTPVLLQALQGLAVTIHLTQSLYRLSLSLPQTDDIFLFPFCLAAPGNFAHTEKVLSPLFVKGVGFEKGRGSLLPFSVFLVPFVTSQKEHPFLFPLEKE